VIVEIAELSVAVRVLQALDRLGVALEAVIMIFEQSSHRMRPYPMPLGGQRLGQLHRRLGRPPQPRHRITPGLGIHQLVQRRPQLRIVMLHRFAPGAGRTHPPINRDPRLQLRGTPSDRVRRGTRRGRDQLDPTTAQPARTRPQQQPPRPLVQHRSHLGQRPSKRLRKLRDLCHSTTLEITNTKADVIYLRVLTKPFWSATWMLIAVWRPSTTATWMLIAVLYALR
jgi:hypothetical protein